MRIKIFLGWNYCLFLFVYYSKRYHTNKNISGMKLLLVPFGYYSKKMFDDVYKHYAVNFYFGTLWNHPRSVTFILLTIVGERESKSRKMGNKNFYTKDQFLIWKNYFNDSPKCFGLKMNYCFFIFSPWPNKLKTFVSRPQTSIFVDALSIKRSSTNYNSFLIDCFI